MTDDATAQIDLLRKRLDREKRARLEAEDLLETKSLELFPHLLQDGYFSRYPLIRDGWPKLKASWLNRFELNLDSQQFL